MFADRIHAAAFVLMDTFWWTAKSQPVPVPVEIKGFWLGGAFTTPLDSRAEPWRPGLKVFSSDVEGVAIGDTISVNGQDFAVVNINADPVLNETYLGLRPL